MRLIDADALRETMYHEAFETDTDMQKWDGGCWIRYKMFENALDNAPTIDAEPTRHGKWIPLYPHDVPITNEYKCSVCGLGFDEDEETECVVYDTFKYCPHCGAKMDGVEE